MDVLHVDPDDTAGPATHEARVAAGVEVQGSDVQAAEATVTKRGRETPAERVTNGVRTP